jgi:Lrp/AsnC family transcriptional regulator
MGYEEYMDQVDRKILQVLQRDSSGSIADIAERANVSQTPCWRRIKKLEEAGVIKARVALLDAKKMNVGLTGFIAIKTANHDEAWLKRFADGVAAIPEVVEFHRMAGDTDYLLKIVTKDIESYDAIYKRLIKVVDLNDVSASFSMEVIKSTTEVPVDYI